MSPDMVVQLQHLLLVAIPIVFSSGLATLLDGVLSQDHFSKLANATITYVITAVFAILSVFAAGKLTGDYAYDFLLLVASATSLLSTGLAPLRHYLRSNVNVQNPDPLASRTLPTAIPDQKTLPQVQATVQVQRTNAPTVEAPIPPTQSGYEVDVPTATNPVPPRASASQVTSGGVVSNATFDGNTPTPRRVPTYQPQSNRRNQGDIGG